ncbi:MAG TPA: glycosyltransferase family 39 protein [Candidatus Hydrogenedentes bacterium]|nr:glycosyltransferase family 39 protein [Candidatus Hydrogenedentota bacterium]HPG69617.1 glycosyltransferase family 39 protein [Candidatus Hydrogenedentota bacterium]
MDGSYRERSENALSTPRALGVLALILVAALAWRLYRIGEESIDLEEYVCVTHLDAPNVVAFIRDLRQTDPAIAPLPFALTYYWSRLAGRSAAALRLLTVVFSVAVIPFLYMLGTVLFGRTPFGRRAGLVAALCFALSPINIVHAQTVRHYALLTFLAAVSAYALACAVHGRGRRWWWVNVAANVLIAWTHLFGVFLIAAQGVYLLVVHRRTLVRSVMWGLAHAVLFAPWYAWVATKPPEPPCAYSAFRRPPLRDLTWDLFGDEIVEMAGAIRVYGNAWAFLSDAQARWLHGAHAWFDVPMVALFCAAVGWGLCSLLRALARRKKDADAEKRSSSAAAGNIAFLLLWYVVPPVTLFVLSHVWRPCHQFRYSVYHMLPLYLLVGGLVAGLPGRWPRAILCVGLVAAYGYQLSITLPGAVRSDWRGAAQHVAAEGAPSDIVLVSGGPIWLETFRINVDEPRPPMCTVFGTDALVEMADTLASTCQTLGDQRAVWALLMQDFERRPSEAFEAALRAQGLDFHRREFTGERHLVLYRLSKDAVTPPGEVAALALPQFAEAMAMHRGDALIESFRGDFRAIPDEDGGAYARLGLELAERDAVPLAAVAFGRALALRPSNLLVFTDLEAAVTGRAVLDMRLDTLLDALPELPRTAARMGQLVEELDGRGLAAAAQRARDSARSQGPSPGTL